MYIYMNMVPFVCNSNVIVNYRPRKPKTTTIKTHKVGVILLSISISLVTHTHTKFPTHPSCLLKIKFGKFH